MASKKAKATSVAVTHLIAPNGKTWCGFEQRNVTKKTNDPDASTCEGCTREWANVQIQNSLGGNGKEPAKAKAKRDEWDAIHYPELTDAENDEIRGARRAGYASMFPAVPDAASQSRRTLFGARAFMNGNGAARFTAVQVNAMHADHEGCFWFKLYRDGEPIRQDGQHVKVKANSIGHAVECAVQLYGTPAPAPVAATERKSDPRKSDPQSLKDTVDMSVIVRTDFKCDGDDADVINDMYMVLDRFLKIGSGDAKLVKDGGDVLARYKGGNKR